MNIGSISTRMHIAWWGNKILNLKIALFVWEVWYIVLLADSFYRHWCGMF